MKYNYTKKIIQNIREKNIENGSYIANRDAIRSLITFNLFMFICIPILIIMGFIAFLQENLILFTLDFFMSIMFISVFIYVKKTGDINLSTNILLITILIFLFCIFYNGGVERTSFMWLFAYPHFSLYLLGMKKGFRLTFILFLCCVIFLFLNIYTDLYNIYNLNFALRFIPSFLFITFLACLVEKSRYQSQIAILNKQSILSETITKLKCKKRELNKARRELEDRVIERTDKLEEINKHLRSEISERARLESELETAQKMKLIGQLAGGVAHDLNNILPGLVTYPELLIMELSPDSDMREPLERIKHAGKRAAAIVEDLLTLARGGVVVRTPLQLNTLILSYLDSPDFQALCRKFPGIEVKKNLDFNLKLVNGSSIHLEKTLMNLILNGFEAINKEKGFVEITTVNVNKITKERKEKEYVVLSVKDTGSGIPEDQFDKIFEPFFSNKSKDRIGTGLGMTVVQSSVEEHNGFIEIDSEIDKGTTLSIYIPSIQEEIISKEIDQNNDIILGNNESILLVDDIKDQRDLGEKTLSRLNYSIVTSNSGEDAIDFVKENKVDLILLDMIMEPGIDGLETLKRIFSINPEQKIIIVSGYHKTEKVKEALNNGAIGIIRKPYSIYKLSDAMHKVFTNQFHELA